MDKEHAPHPRRLLHKVHLPFRGPWPRASHVRIALQTGPWLETYSYNSELADRRGRGTYGRIKSIAAHGRQGRCSLQHRRSGLQHRAPRGEGWPPLPMLLGGVLHEDDLGEASLRSALIGLGYIGDANPPLKPHLQGVDTHSDTQDSSSSSTSPGTSAGESSSPAELDSLSALTAQLIEEEDWEAALKNVVEEHDLACHTRGERDERALQALETYAGVLWQLGRTRDGLELLENLVSTRTDVRCGPRPPPEPRPCCMRRRPRPEPHPLGPLAWLPQIVSTSDPTDGESFTKAESLLADALLQLSTVRVSPLGRCPRPCAHAHIHNRLRMPPPRTRRVRLLTPTHARATPALSRGPLVLPFCAGPHRAGARRRCRVASAARSRHPRGRVWWDERGGRAAGCGRRGERRGARGQRSARACARRGAYGGCGRGGTAQESTDEKGAARPRVTRDRRLPQRARRGASAVWAARARGAGGARGPRASHRALRGGSLAHGDVPGQPGDADDSAGQVPSRGDPAAPLHRHLRGTAGADTRGLGRGAR